MLNEWQYFLLPFAIDDLFVGPENNPRDWMRISPEQDSIIRNFIQTAPSNGGEVLLDINNYKVLIWVSDRYYAVSLNGNPNVTINDWLGNVIVEQPPRGAMRNLTPHTIVKTQEEMTPFIEWKQKLYWAATRWIRWQGDVDNYVPTIPNDAKALFTSWIQELGGVSMDMEVTSAMIFWGYWDTVLTELNSNPQDYYIQLSPEMDLNWFFIEDSETCYPGIQLYTYNDLDNPVVLYYAGEASWNTRSVAANWWIAQPWEWRLCDMR